MNILGIDNVVIDVANLESARYFYGTVLGLVEKYVFPNPGVVGYRIGSEEPGFVIRANASGATADGRGPRIWLEVEDARKAAAHLVDAGVELLGDPSRIRTGWVVEVADPSGNVIGLTDYADAPERARSTRPPHRPR